ALAAFRDRAEGPGSRAVLGALIDVQGDAAPAVRAAVVDWMTELQPLGVPAWTLAEAARAAGDVPAARVVRAADLDQPRSAAQRERLLGMLASDVPDRRDAAARTLLAWPEPDARAVVLDAYLRGRTDVPAGSAFVGTLSRALRRALTEADPETLFPSDVPPGSELVADPHRALIGTDPEVLSAADLPPGSANAADPHRTPTEADPETPFAADAPPGSANAADPHRTPTKADPEAPFAADMPPGSANADVPHHTPAEADPKTALDDEMRADPSARLAAGVDARRLARLAAGLDARDLEPLLPVLLHLWERGSAAARADAAQALRRVSADVLASRLQPRIAAGATGLLDLLADRPLLRTPALARLSERYPDARLVLVDGPLRGPDAAAEDAAALRALRVRTPLAAPRPLSREELVLLARSGEPERIRRALTHLTEHPTRLPQTELAELLEELLAHPQTGIRLHAHRTSRALLDRETHLQLTEVLLDDPQPDVVRTAIRVLVHARRRPAIPALISLLDHAHVTVRRTAEDGLVGIGSAAVPALRRAVSRARPDRSARYAALLARIAEQEQEQEQDPPR
ncbi:HEAT repeat domain-containing protein, partial [Streptomyces sp.]|uniref:HEAT repeat domain-containing protein n=1 Tax=Streptomyces sp. TaxID=1931 RepID=UPI002F959666